MGRKDGLDDDEGFVLTSPTPGFKSMVRTHMQNKKPDVEVCICEPSTVEEETVKPPGLANW